MYGVPWALVKGKTNENFFQHLIVSAYTRWMLCQFNIMIMAHPKDSPQMASYFAAAPEVYAMADTMPGLIWRQTDETDPVIHERLGPNSLVNMTGWESIDALYAFVFHPTHRAIMMARDHWFAHTGRATSVMWHQDTAEKPSFSQAIDRLESLWREGPHAEAFDFSWAQQHGLADPHTRLQIDL